MRNVAAALGIFHDGICIHRADDHRQSNACALRMEVKISHTTTIRGINITDANAIRAAVASLAAKGVNIALIENATPRMYYAQQAQDVGVCEFVLKLPDAQYDVGLKWQENCDSAGNGTGEYAYHPVFDEWAGSVHSQIGGQCAIPQTPEERALWAISEFSRAYNTTVVKQTAQAQGYTLVETNQGGVTQLEITNPYG